MYTIKTRVHRFPFYHSTCVSTSKFKFQIKNCFINPSEITFLNDTILSHNCIVRLDVTLLFVFRSLVIVIFIAQAASTCGDMFAYKNYGHDLAALPRAYLPESWNKLQKELRRDLIFQKSHGFLNRRQTYVLPLQLLVCVLDKHTSFMYSSPPIGSLLSECGDDVGILDHIWFL